MNNCWQNGTKSAQAKNIEIGRKITIKILRKVEKYWERDKGEEVVCTHKQENDIGRSIERTRK